MSTRIGAHLRSNVVGYVALFLALGGLAWAAGLPKNSVKSKQIKDGGVKSVDVADDSLTGADVRESALDLPVGPTGPQGETGPAGSPDTPQQVLGKLLTVDGAGSGIDADAVDGVDSAQITRGPGLRTGVAIGMIANFATEWRPFAGFVDVQLSCSAGGVPGVAVQNITGAETKAYTDSGGPDPVADVALADGASTAVTSGAVTDGSADHVTFWVGGNALPSATVDVWAENRLGNTNCGFLVRADGLGQFSPG